MARIAVVVMLIGGGLALPGAAQSFRNVTDRFDDPGPGYAVINGASAVDVNQDGLVDLYHRNRLHLQRPDGTFRSVLDEIGLTNEGQAVFGAIFGDYDGDGRLDVFFEDLLPPGHLFRNRGGGTFAFANDAVGVTFDALVQGSAWGDYDGDGHLDLFVGSDDGMNRLFRNAGAGRFQDVSAGAGLAYPGNSYGVAAADYDLDGDLDVFIATCSSTAANSVKLLLRNDADGTFTDVAFEAGVDDDRASWGVVWLDVDNDGWQDLFVGNMPMPDGRPGYNRLYWNDRNGRFLEIGLSAGVAGSAADFTLGVAAADVDNDGWQDLVVSNNTGTQYQLFRNRGDYTFHEVALGPLPASGRGGVVAVADVDGDGWVDLYLPRSEEEVLLLNEGGTHHWITLHLRSPTGNRFGVGARIDLFADGRHQVREITAGDGMTSQNHNLSAHFGLGTATRVDSVVVHWPHGGVDRVVDLEADQAVTVVEGLGVNPPPPVFRLLEPSDEAVLTAAEGPVTFRWEDGAAVGGEALTYTLFLDGAGRVLEGLTEPRATLDAADLPANVPLYWTVEATDGHTLRASVDRFRLVRTVATSTDDPDDVPEAVLSLTAYPNPSRDGAVVRFRLPAPTHTVMRVYDVTGRLVRTLLDATRAPGEHVQTWDGRDEHGAHLPAGVYLLHLQTSQAVRVRSLVLVR